MIKEKLCLRKHAEKLSGELYDYSDQEDWLLLGIHDPIQDPLHFSDRPELPKCSHEDKQIGDQEA